MKKLMVIGVSLILLLSGCGNETDFDYTYQITDAPIITVSQEGKSLFCYQGFIDLDITGVGQIGKVEFSDITLEKGKTGIASIHKGGAEFFDPIDVRNIEQELAAGKKYDYLEYDMGEIGKKENKYTIKLQYIILNVPTDIARETIKRTVTMKMKLYDASGKTIGSKNIQIEIQ